MSVDFTPWPEDLARRYREKGYWRGEPLTALLAKRLEIAPDATAIICGERRFNYAELDAWSTSLAIGFSRQGLRAGDTALVQLPNVAEFYAVLFALLKIGVAPVNALFSHNRLELSAYADQIRPALLIASARHPLFANGAYVEALQIAIPALRVVQILGETSYAESLAPFAERRYAVSARELRGSAPGEVAFLQLSGGSTGAPKLIPRTHDDYYYSLRRSAEICGLTEKSRYLCALPAPHNFPLSSPGALGVFHMGGTVVLATDPSPSVCFDLIRRHGVDIAAVAPPIAMLWLEAAADEAPLSSLRLLQVGGARLGETVARRIPATLGCRLQQVFGMAEGLVNYTRLDDDEETIFTTQGRPMCEDDEVKIVDAQGAPVGVGEIGELLTRGPYTFRGYHRAAEENARAFDAEGFYRSGDLVRLTETGHIQVVGRKKDQINRGGEKFAAEELENLLLTHAQIADAALVATPDALMGEKSCACVVARGDVRPLALRKHLRALGVAEFKLPDRFEFLERLPVTAAGKIDKRALRDLVSSRPAS
ncbi:2,3-dihydroxybenzoate-AMP ligase [Methylosinus sp. sav-2]|uniref:(2,3-dihydroxybenzoyl)adenylate synthase n=1 Tax=Methylosinus sp. sav-2 TaxID=2485168 RepID=UPI00047C5D1F|nr:(2,3-dihydroxybenzoyl)adenylate synthase [Methylosinus sp. sav-2]TDX62537.1 2,3-dihydroxybenzoate-AMP ligase [Methylosinus sp. sav-2]